MSVKSFSKKVTMQKPRTIETIRGKYSDSKYVFKKCVDVDDSEYEGKERKWLVVLEKLSDTRTTEKRDGVYNPNFAKFRADKLKVIEIINVNNLNNDKKSITNVYTDNKYEGYDDVIYHKMVYTVNDVVFPDFFDDCIDNVCSNGIHYFKSFDMAFAYEKNSHMGAKVKTAKLIDSKP